MTIGGFFDFDKTEYAHRISYYDIDRLQSKLKLIRAELKKRDILIPLGACAAGMGVGHVFDQAAIHVTHTCAPDLFPGDSVSHAFSMNPGDSISGAAHGAAQQLHEMGHALMSLDNGVPAAHELATVAISVPQTSVEEAVGFHAGMGAMQVAEKGLASVASSSLATQGMKAMTGDTDQMDALHNY
ncbi:hypothetical protein FNYG_07443 [Fusarium nygamai]|uniref:Uncharacterized protein n=1 Tax=Gibberella nygamai TaxID=42673 RepID=A0A2K0WAR1_GIBNY|nr:hypothetical protein FNYG_07443 [Fusarium nygamai]